MCYKAHVHNNRLTLHIPPTDAFYFGTKSTTVSHSCENSVLYDHYFHPLASLCDITRNSCNYSNNIVVVVCALDGGGGGLVTR